jgi:hypothetical protein
MSSDRVPRRIPSPRGPVVLVVSPEGVVSQPDSGWHERPGSG